MEPCLWRPRRERRLRDEPLRWRLPLAGDASPTPEEEDDDGGAPPTTAAAPPTTMTPAAATTAGLFGLWLVHTYKDVDLRRPCDRSSRASA